MPRVLNKRTDKISPNAILIDRTTKWGNKFRIGLNCTREEAISRHKAWVNEQIQLGNVGFGIQFKYNLEELQGHDLVCWCAPQPCHGDLWLELANK